MEHSQPLPNNWLQFNKLVFGVNFYNFSSNQPLNFLFEKTKKMSDCVALYALHRSQKGGSCKSNCQAHNISYVSYDMIFLTRSNVYRLVRNFSINIIFVKLIADGGKSHDKKNVCILKAILNQL